MISREELIADWQKRLAAAEQPHPDHSAREQWFARVRVRLYRFLLSLYSSGQWRASSNRTSDVACLQTKPRAETAIDLDGKPAKNAAAIREALVAVAAARSNTNQPGPLLGGSGEDRWMIAARLSGGIQTERLSGMLEGRGIAHRLVHHGSDLTLEVRAKELTYVSRIIVANIDRLRWFARPVVLTRPGLMESLVSIPAKCIAAIPPRWRFHLVSAGQILLVFPLASWFASMMLALCPDDPDLLVTAYRYDEFYWTGLRGITLIMLSLIWLRAHWQSRRATSMRKALHAPTGTGQ